MFVVLINGAFKSSICIFVSENKVIKGSEHNEGV